MKVYVTVGLVVVAVLGLVMLMTVPKIMAKTSEPVYCASCHVMEAEYTAWGKAGAHSRKWCVECHLPHQNQAAYYVWKSLDGMKDMYVFHLGRVPDEIHASEHAREVLQANCIRCHAEAVAHIQKDRQCWSCHKRITHRYSGMRDTI